MPVRLSIVAAIVAFLVLLLVFEQIRRRRLQERYAILWIAIGVIVLVLALWRQGLETLADFVGISYPPSLLFAVAGVLVLVVLLHFTTVISRLEERTKRMAQRIAILESRLDEERGLDGSEPERFAERERIEDREPALGRARRR